MKSVVKFGLKTDIIMLFYTHASECVLNLMHTYVLSSLYGLFQVAGLESQNRQLQKSVGDLERMILDVNCINSKLHDENKSLKERLAKETEKCNDMACRLRPVEAALSQVSQQVVDLTKQLVSLDTFVDNVFIILASSTFFKILLIIFVEKHFYQR